MTFNVQDIEAVGFIGGWYAYSTACTTSRAVQSIAAFTILILHALGFANAI
jgi:hypothetical protein